jgi:RNA polymerase sigma-70 factor (ECF subfamily)
MYTQSEFDAWYQREHPRVLGALTVVAGNPDVAADATAEAFVRAYERWDRVRLMTSPGGRLYSVALNVVRRRARRLTLERELVRRDRYTMGTPWCGGSVPLPWRGHLCVHPRSSGRMAVEAAAVETGDV